jgi:hypothetical protein
MRGDRERPDRSEQDRGAIGIGARNVLMRDIAARTGAVVDQDRYAKVVGEFSRSGARQYRPHRRPQSRPPS